MQKLRNYSQQHLDSLYAKYSELYDTATSPWAGGFDMIHTHDLEHLDNALYLAGDVAGDEDGNIEDPLYGCLWGAYTLPVFEPLDNPVEGIEETAVAVANLHVPAARGVMDWLLYLHLNKTPDGELHGYLELIARDLYRSEQQIILRYRTDDKKTAPALAANFPARYWLAGMGDERFDVASFAHPQLIKIASEYGTNPNED